jgi:hypothetical protein
MHARARKERDLDGRDRRNRAHWRCLIEPVAGAPAAPRAISAPDP